MAKKKKAKSADNAQQEGQPKKNKKGGGKILKKLFAASFLIGSLAFMPTTILVILGMIPSVVALYTDDDRKKMGGLAVAFLNLGAVIAFVNILWDRGHSLANSLTLLMNPTTLLVIYFAAFIGFILVRFLPPIVAEFLKITHRKRMKVIEAEQKAIIEQWGYEVKGAIEG